jgi:hypothetical protein
MDIELSEIDYVQKCLEQYRANKALAEKKMEVKESYLARSKFLNELMAECKTIADDTTSRGRLSYLTLYEAAKGVIRVSIGLRSCINLRPGDIPRAREIAKKVFEIVKEERGGKDNG